jgi:hypothetical protein
MKKINAKKQIKHLLEDKKFEKKMILSTIKGGNNSDVQYVDSHNDTSGSWGIDVNSVIDQVDSSESLDKPNTGTVFV